MMNVSIEPACSEVSWNQGSCLNPNEESKAQIFQEILSKLRCGTPVLLKKCLCVSCFQNASENLVEIVFIDIR